MNKDILLITLEKKTQKKKNLSLPGSDPGKSSSLLNRKTLFQ